MFQNETPKRNQNIDSLIQIQDIWTARSAHDSADAGGTRRERHGFAAARMVAMNSSDDQISDRRRKARRIEEASLSPSNEEEAGELPDA